MTNTDESATMEIVTVPVKWMTYAVPGGVTAIMGSTLTMPPQLVLEHLVAKGIAKRVGTVSTFDARAIEDDEDEDEKGGDVPPGPWLPDKDD